MSKKDQLNKMKKIIVPILKRNDVIKAGIFGSYARGEQKKDSDVDLLIKYGSKKKSLFDLIGLKLELKKKLNREVDLITYKYINPLIKERILKEEVRII